MKTIQIAEVQGQPVYTQVMTLAEYMKAEKERNK